MRLATCLFLLLITPLFNVNAIAANQRQQFRCSRCGGAIVKCPRCGQFQHANSAHIRAAQQGNPQGQIATGPQGSRGQFPGQGGFGSQPGQHVGNPGFQRFDPPNSSRAPAQIAGQPDPIQPISHEQSHREPEQGLDAVGQLSPRQSVGHQADGGNAPRGVNYKLTGTGAYADKVNHCNGFIAGKHDIGNGFCLYPVGTAEHCAKVKRSDMKSQTNTGMRDQPFGMEWVGKIEIEGKTYEPIAFSRPDAEMRKSADVAIFAIKGSCGDFPNDRVYDIDASNPQQNEKLQFRKSMFWANIDQTLGYGPRGRAWNAANIAGRVLSVVAGMKRFPEGGEVPEVSIVDNNTIEPGDSGLPVGKGGKITGILSGYPGQAPFRGFFYSPGEPMAWMKRELEANFGASVVSTMKEPPSIANR